MTLRRGHSFSESDRPGTHSPIFTLPPNASISQDFGGNGRGWEGQLEAMKTFCSGSTYVGQGAPRFLLAYDVPPLQRPNIGQIVISDALRGKRVMH